MAIMPILTADAVQRQHRVEEFHHLGCCCQLGLNVRPEDVGAAGHADGCLVWREHPRGRGDAGPEVLSFRTNGVQSTAIRQTKMIAKDVRVVGDVGGEGVDRGQEEYDGLGPQNHQMRPTRFDADTSWRGFDA